MENKILTTNFHTHTTRCNHAAGEDRQYVEEAIKGGLKVLAFQTIHHISFQEIITLHSV